MADVKISGLNPTTSATDSDFFIINKGDSTTQKIRFDNLASAIEGTIDLPEFPEIPDTSFAPILYNFPSEFNAKFDTAAWNSVTGGLFDVDSPGIKMPDGSNAAVLYCEYGFKGEARVGITKGPGQSYTRIGRDFTFTGPGVSVVGGSSSPNDVAMGMALGFPHEATAYQTSTQREAQGIQNRNGKVCILYYNDGATININSYCKHIASKQILFSTSVGRVLMIPFNRNSAAFSAFAQSFAINDNSFEDEMPDVTPEENEYQLNDILRSEMRFLLDQGDNAVRYDPTITDAERSTLETELGNILQLKTSTDSYEDVQAELDRIYDVMAGILEYKFDWQQYTGRSM
jgi:hypothetical protein